MNKKYKFGEGRVSEKEKDYLEQKLSKIEKLLEGYDSQDELLCEIEFQQDKKGFWYLEIMIQTPHNLYRVEETDSELTCAIDKAETALKKQIIRHKDKTREMRERRGRSLRKNVTVNSEARF